MAFEFSGYIADILCLCKMQTLIYSRDINEENTAQFMALQLVRISPLLHINTSMFPIFIMAATKLWLNKFPLAAKLLTMFLDDLSDASSWFAILLVGVAQTGYHSLVGILTTATRIQIF